MAAAPQCYSPLTALPTTLQPPAPPSTLQVADAVQLITDTMPKQGGGGGGQTREEAVDALCCELLGKVGGLGVSWW